MLTYLLEHPLMLTVGLIFLTALVSTFVRRRSRDRCLKDFEGFHVTVELEDEKRLWGRLEVFPRALHLVYPRPHQDAKGHEETSFLILGDQIDKVQSLRRYHDELTDKNQKRRRKDIDRTYHPGLIRRLVRWARNILNTFRDAFVQSMGAAMAHAKKTGGPAAIAAGDKGVAKAGEQVLGLAANAYEPVLERYIGRRVVVEELRGGKWFEHPGILKDYTAAWIEVLDCRDRREEEFLLADPDRFRMNRHVDFTIEHVIDDAGGVASLTVEIENHGDDPIHLLRAKAEGYERHLELVAPPGGTLRAEFTDLPLDLYEGIDVAALPERLSLRAATRSESTGSFDAPPLPALSLVLAFGRELDLCLPRARAVIRHGGEPI